MRIIILIVLVIFGLTAVACTSEAPSPADTQTASPPTPDVPATVEAGVRGTREAETAIDATVEAKVAAILTTSAPSPTPMLTATPRPTNTPWPTSTPGQTNTPRPTATPYPTAVPQPTPTPTPTPTAHSLHPRLHLRPRVRRSSLWGWLLLCPVHAEMEPTIPPCRSPACWERTNLPRGGQIAPKSPTCRTSGCRL